MHIVILGNLAYLKKKKWKAIFVQANKFFSDFSKDNIAQSKYLWAYLKENLFNIFSVMEA